MHNIIYYSWSSSAAYFQTAARIPINAHQWRIGEYSSPRLGRELQ